MPNQYVDERVARVRYEGDDFEKGAARTLDTIEKLNKAMRFEKVGDIGASAIEKAINGIQNKFSALEVAGRRTVERLTDGFLNLAKQAVTAADSIRPGYQKYEEQVQHVQKLINSTGKPAEEVMDQVQALSDKILWFTDETSYQYTSMMQTMASFASSGVGLEDAADIILGLAVEAGKAGASASEATHAFTGFQRAIAQGYMGTNQWEWIKTAGMNTNEFQQELINAALATGALQQSSEGLAKTLKGTTVTADNFGTTLGEKWLSAESVIKTAKKYSVAVGQIYSILNDPNADLDTVKQVMDEFGGQLDQFSLQAFRAGQETKTWSDAVNALKSAMSSGWMKSFEFIIGNYKEASGFFTNLIEPLWDIFLSSGERRNSFLETAFGSSGKTTKTVANWDKLKKKIEETGHTMEEFDEAWRRHSPNPDSIESTYGVWGNLEDMMKAGAVHVSALEEVLKDLGITTTETAEIMVEGAVDATSALEKYKQVAMEVLRGDYGNGQERRDAIEAMGLDFDTVQWLVGNLKNGKGFDAITLEWFESTAPNAYQHFIDIIGNGNYVINGATGELIALSDVVDEIGDKMAGMTGRELWQGGILNIANAISEALGAIKEAFDEVFGTPAERGRGVRAFLESFYRMTEGLEMTDERLEKIKKTAKGVFQVFGGFGYWIKTAIKAIKQLNRIPLAILDKLLSLFTGGHNINHEFGTFGSILERISIIVQKISKWAQPLIEKAIDGIDDIIGKLKEFSFKEFFKPLTNFFKSDNPIATFLRTVVEPFTKMFSGEGSLMEKISGFFSGFSKNTDDMTKSMDNVTASVRGMTDIFGGVLDGDESTLKEKIGRVWETIKKFVAEKYREMNWENVIDAGKLGLVGYLFVRLGELFRTMNKSVKMMTQNGPFGAIQALVNNFSAPFVALSKTIERVGNANRYLVIAAAIGILAGSIWALSKIPTDDFYNVTVVLGVLMAIMAKMAQNMNGFSLFSNNTKTKSKNNPITNTIKAFENLTSAFSIDFKGNKFNFSVFSNAMQVMIGIAVLIGAVLAAFMKIRAMNIQDIHELDNELVVFGILVGTVAVLGTVISLAAGEAKYGFRSAILLVAVAKVISMIVNTFMGLIDTLAENFKDQSKMKGFAAALALMMGTIAMIIGFVIVSGSSVPHGDLSGKSLLAMAASVIAFALAIKMIVKAVGSASEIKNVGQGLAVMSGLAIGLIAVMTTLDFLADQSKNGAKGVLAISASAMLLALALTILVPALALMSTLNPAGMIAGAAALGLLFIALAGTMTILSKIDTKKLLVVSLAMGLLVVALGALLLAVRSFTATMVGLSQLPWVQMKANFQAMHDVLSPELPLFLGLGLAAAVFGVGLLVAAAAGGVFGLSFLAIAAGIYLVAAALPMLIDGIIYFVDRINENGWKLLEFIGIILAAVLLYFIASKTQILAVIEDYAVSIVNLLKNGKLIKGILGVLATLLILGVDFIEQMVGPLVGRLIKILVTLVNSLAESIRSNKGDIAGALYNLIQALFELIGEVIIQGLGLLGKGASKLKQWFSDLFGVGDGVITAYALDADNIDVISDTSGLEEKAAATAEEDKMAIADAYASAFVDSNGLGTSTTIPTDFTGMSEEEQEQWLDTMMGFPSDTEVTNMAQQRGQEDGQVALNSYTNGIASVFNSGMLGGDLGGDMTSLMGGFGGVMGTDGSMLGGGTNVLGSLQNFIGGSFGSPEITNQVTESGEATSMSWLSSLGNKLADGLNIETMIGNIGGFVQSTFGSQPTLDNFYNAGTQEGDSNVTGIETQLFSGDANARMYNSGVNLSNQVYYGWTDTTDVNAPAMSNYMVLGMENAVYNDENLADRLKALGARMYELVEAGMRTRAGIASPSKEMEKNGEYLMLGLIGGIESGSEDAFGVGQSSMGGILNAFQQAISMIMAVVNDQLSVQPTITPVVDMTNVNDAISSIQNGFNTGYNFTTDLTENVGRQNQRTQPTSEPESRFTSDATGLSGVAINVYPSQGMDEKALADKVIYRLGEINQRRRAAAGG